MQILVNGFINGLTISLLALAFSVVYLPTRIFHIAVGGVYAIAPFVSWACLKWGLPLHLAALIGVLVSVLFSLIFEAVVHSSLDSVKASSGAHLISSLGIYIVIVQAIALLWGNETKVLRTGLDLVWAVAGVVLTRSQILSVGVSIILLLMFFGWLIFTNLGIRFRALADNPRELALRGYNVRYLRLLAFGISGLLGSSGALLTVLDVGFTPQGGLPAVLLAIVAMIIGGKESFLGPVFGGILLGLVRSEVVWFLSARWQEALTFLLLTLFLFVWPTGLLGRRGRLEAAT